MAKPFPAPKDPADIAHYAYDFAPILGDDETIVGTPVVTVAVKGSTDPSDLVVVGNPSVIGQTVTALLSGGSLSSTYVVTFAITTSEGQTFDRAGLLKVRDL